MPCTHSQFVFALLDFKANEEHIVKTYFVAREGTPRMVVLRKSDGNRAFAVDAVGEAAGGEAAIAAFLRRVSAGRVPFEYEGPWGLPARWWRIASSRAPFLARLDFLPSYSIAGTNVVFFVLMVLYLLFVSGMGELSDEPPPPPPKAHGSARTKKVD